MPDDQLEHVNRLILQPMQLLYPTPHHLRDNPTARKLMLNQYARGLARFAPEVLEKAWERVVENNDMWVWPKLSDIIHAARAVETETRKARGNTNDDPRYQQALDLAWTYREKYSQSSKLASLAEREGWKQFLDSYVFEAAWLQAQYLCRVPMVGYSSVLVAGLLSADEKQTKLQDVLTQAKRQAEKGHIRVHIPKDMITWWKSRLTTQERER